MTGASRPAAAIDIGSNSVHLLVGATQGTRVRPLLDESVKLGLGAAVDRAGIIPDDARDAVVEAVRAYAERARSLGAEHIAVLATEPLRRATNRSLLQQAVLDAVGLPLQVLTHEAEAFLTLLGVTGGRLPAAPIMVIDIGGGSTEVIVAAAGGDPVVAAFPIGSARLAASFIDTDPPSAEAIAAMRAEARRLFAGLPAVRPARAVAVGGTGSNLNRLLARGRGGFLTRALLERAMATLASWPAEVLAPPRLLTEQRVRQLPAGVALLEAALERYELRRIQASEASLREGAILAAAAVGAEWLERISDPRASPPRGIVQPGPASTTEGRDHGWATRRSPDPGGSRPDRRRGDPPGQRRRRGRSTNREPLGLENAHIL